MLGRHKVDPYGIGLEPRIPVGADLVSALTSALEAGPPIPRILNPNPKPLQS